MLREGERPPIDIRYNNKNQYNNQNQLYDGEEEE